jgi:TolB-like protein
MKRLKYLLIFIAAFGLTSLSSEERVAVFPPENQSRDSQWDYLGDLIQGSLYTFMKTSKSYQLIPVENISRFFIRHQFRKTDLGQTDLLTLAGKEIRADKIVTGSFQRENDAFHLEIEIFDCLEKKTVYRNRLQFNTVLDSFAGVDLLVQQITEDFLNETIESTGFFLTTDEPVSVRINSVPAGQTPLRRTLPAGRYQLDFYPLNTSDKSPVKTLEVELTRENFSLHVPLTARIQRVDQRNLFELRLNSPPVQTGLSEQELTVFYGRQNLKIFLRDGTKRFLWSENRIILNPGETRTVDLDRIDFQYRWQWVFLPGALQFYNHQYLKGGLLLAFFITAFTGAVLAYPASYLYDQTVFQPAWNDYNYHRDTTSWTAAQILSMKETGQGLLIGFLSGFISLAVLLHVVSATDGLWNLNRIHRIFHPSTNAPSIGFDLRLKS